MKPAQIAGRGLACALGLDLAGCVDAMRSGRASGCAASRQLPGGMGGDFPYHAIPYEHADWYERARHLVTRVADEAGAAQARDGVLLIATSSFDIGAIEAGEGHWEPAGNRVFMERVASWLQWRGPVHAINTACTSSMNALLTGRALLDQGKFGDVLVLGIELENRLTLGGFASLQLLSRTRCKPFGLDRDGLVLGEAVAALRLTTGGDAPWRLAGGANVVDGSQPTNASPTALADMYCQALSASGLAPADIDLVKVQAAGSPGNDAAEAQALRVAFGRLPALVSLKAMIGHCLGASGAAEIALLMACLECGAWPVWPDALDPALGVGFGRAPGDVRRVLATILGFGGSHASVVLERT